MLVAYLLRHFVQFEWACIPHTRLEAIAHSVDPYPVYVVADRLYGLQASLANSGPGPWLGFAGVRLACLGAK